MFFFVLSDAKNDEWSSWSACSVTCGEGWQSRTRLCATSSFTTQCTGPLRENRPCNNTVVCPGEPPPPLLLLHLKKRCRKCSSNSWRCQCFFLNCFGWFWKEAAIHSHQNNHSYQIQMAVRLHHLAEKWQNATWNSKKINKKNITLVNVFIYL